MGELGLKPWEFDAYTWEEYCYAAHGYFIRQARDREPIRLLTTILWNVNAEKKDQKTPEQLYGLLTDANEVRHTEDKEAAQQRFERAKELEKRLNEKMAKLHGNRVTG